MLWELSIDSIPVVTEAERAHPISDPYLTARQQKYLGLLAQGFSYKEIGLRTGVATNTVHKYLREIYLKMDVKSGVEAAVEGIKLGLVDGRDVLKNVDIKAPISPHEERILEAITRTNGKGSTNKLIADDLYYSQFTVRSRISGILDKYGARNRVHVAAVYALIKYSDVTEPSIDIGVKFTPDIDLQRQVGITGGLRGVRELIQLFPDQRGDLGRFFFVRVGPKSVESIMDQLKRDPQVEFSERAKPML